MDSDITYTWRDATVLWTDIPVDGAVAGSLLPPGLLLGDPPTATIFVADYPFTAFGSVYREAAVLLHGVDEKGPFVHCPWMVVDDDTALILGRELLGFPKKMAEISLSVQPDHVVGTVTRKGVELIRIEGAADSAETSPPALFDRRFVNLFGSIVGGMSLIEIAPAGENVHQCLRGEGKILLGSSDRDALGVLAPASESILRLSTLDFASGNAAAAVPPIIDTVTDEGWALARFFARLA